jgi:hypothetical protein
MLLLHAAACKMQLPHFVHGSLAVLLLAGVCLPQVWSVGAGGDRYQRWWGEQHLGDMRVRRHGHSTTGRLRMCLSPECQLRLKVHSCCYLMPTCLVQLLCNRLPSFGSGAAALDCLSTPVLDTIVMHDVYQ